MDSFKETIEKIMEKRPICKTVFGKEQIEIGFTYNTNIDTDIYALLLGNNNEILDIVSYNHRELPNIASISSNLSPASLLGNVDECCEINLGNMPSVVKTIIVGCAAYQRYWFTKFTDSTVIECSVAGKSSILTHYPIYAIAHGLSGYGNTVIGMFERETSCWRFSGLAYPLALLGEIIKDSSIGDKQ